MSQAGSLQFHVSSRPWLHATRAEFPRNSATPFLGSRQYLLQHATPQTSSLHLQRMHGLAPLHPGCLSYLNSGSPALPTYAFALFCAWSLRSKFPGSQTRLTSIKISQSHLCPRPATHSQSGPLSPTRPLEVLGFLSLTPWGPPKRGLTPPAWGWFQALCVWSQIHVSMISHPCPLTLASAPTLTLAPVSLTPEAWKVATTPRPTDTSLLLCVSSSSRPLLFLLTCWQLLYCKRHPRTGTGWAGGFGTGWGWRQTDPGWEAGQGSGQV